MFYLIICDVQRNPAILFLDKTLTTKESVFGVAYNWFNCVPLDIVRNREIEKPMLLK